MGLFEKLGLKKPGDKMEAYVTPTNKKVIKITKDDSKVSAVQYDNGTIVETRSYKAKSKKFFPFIEEKNE